MSDSPFAALLSKCGREFKRTNQGHYCGKAPESVKEYIELQAPEACAHSLELRDIILRSVPDIRERIAWSMPFFEKDAHTLSFAVCKNHISLYLDADIIKAIQPQLSAFVIKKNAVYLPHNRELPIKAMEHAIKTEPYPGRWTTHVVLGAVFLRSACQLFDFLIK